jgi:hypothetical protein
MSIQLSIDRAGDLTTKRTFFHVSFPAIKNPGDRQHVYTIYVSGGDMGGVGKSQTDTVKIN